MFTIAGRMLLMSVMFSVLVTTTAGSSCQADDPASTVVYDYKSALDQVTQELVFRVDKGPVLLVWCFDESESMKDDQHEIRVRLKRIHEELQMLKGLADDAVLTVVTSYGGHFHLRTRKPTADVSKIQHAIDTIQVDRSGKELMCSAVGQTIKLCRKWADKRQMMVIVVTDESGDVLDNRKNLEPAIATAQANDCPVYFLGRQAAFGSPFGYLRWRHPQTKRFHWLRTDSGPETATLQVLQTDGFGPRRDQTASGFGSYTQMRLVRETRGVYFTLPSIESSLAGAAVRFKPDVLRHYRPDWRSRAEILADVQRHPLRNQLSKIIADLNPNDDKAGKELTIRKRFSIEPVQFQAEAEREVEKLDRYIDRLVAAEKALVAVQDQRQAETSRRWQASYDLTLAQLVSFQARMQSYRALILQLDKNIPEAPATRKPNLQLTAWQIMTSKKNNVAASVKTAERAVPLLRAVIENHRGTPWSWLADGELKRGFGTAVLPKYEPPTVRVPQPIPPPVL